MFLSLLNENNKMITFLEFLEHEKHAVFTFGRFNPPHKGHELLANAVHREATKHKANSFMFTSNSHDKKKNPLTPQEKLKFLKLSFPFIDRIENSTNIITVAQMLQKKGYTHITLVVGSDQVESFTKLLTKYNGKDFSFRDIRVVNAGDRVETDDTVVGISGTKMRKYALEGDIEKFKAFCPSKLNDKDVKELLSIVQKAMS